MSEPDELYVMARRVLLDALGALGDHRDTIVVVGARAWVREQLGTGKWRTPTRAADPAVDLATRPLPPSELLMPEVELQQINVERPRPVKVPRSKGRGGS